MHLLPRVQLEIRQQTRLRRVMTAPNLERAFQPRAVQMQRAVILLRILVRVLLALAAAVQVVVVEWAWALALALVRVLAQALVWTTLP